MNPLPPPRHGRTPYIVPRTSVALGNRTNRKRKHATEGAGNVANNESDANKKGKQL